MRTCWWSGIYGKILILRFFLILLRRLHHDKLLQHPSKNLFGMRRMKTKVRTRATVLMILGWNWKVWEGLRLISQGQTLAKKNLAGISHPLKGGMTM